MADIIESRWPALAKAADLKRITGTLRGKVPASKHAVADMLDGAAQRAAAEAGCTVIAAAGEPYPGEADEEYQEAVTKDVTEPDPANPKKKVTRKVQTTETRTRKVPTLSRDYWAAPTG